MSFLVFHHQILIAIMVWELVKLMKIIKLNVFTYPQIQEQYVAMDGVMININVVNNLQIILLVTLQALDPFF